ncbi:uroporphyrinogen decarboxylase family protein [Bifidobacterium platyrrhinorum]|uniref:Uroporphyrinogen decarboxylase n=1 Tax=Bifidobacterium platyrrhinorum TaxID=2661628 RepID=A0A6L9SSY9_9BIFI|nr:uroporphyrinogen decarboxylase family protein [Bifidobacterium platyrrhinorum]NEG55189.1 uroporphyrinogen decarboxylase [Bifidobacterium platyrrhinorum]
MTDLRATFRDIIHGTSDVPYLVGAWQHQVGHEYGAEDFADAYIDFVRRWNWEWVKINPRAIYYAEAWGSHYDKDDYAGYVIPKKIDDIVTSTDDVAKIRELDPKENPYFAEELAAAARIRAAFTDRAVIQTIFSPLSVLLELADIPLYPGDAYATPSATVEQVVYARPDLAHAALGNIARTLAAYATALVTPAEQGGAGLDGVFLALTGTVSENYFDAGQYAEFSEPYDRIVIDAVRKANPDAAVVLHTCRADSHPEWFDRLGVDAIHWDQYLPGNPKADAPIKAVPVAGANVDLFVPGADPAQVTRELKETIALREGRPFLLAPSCTVTTPANEASLQALSDARVATAV